MFSPNITVPFSGNCAMSACSRLLVVMAGCVSRLTSSNPSALIGSHASQAQEEITTAEINVATRQARRRAHSPHSIAGIKTRPSSCVPGHSSPAARVADPMCQGNARLIKVPIPGPNTVKVIVVMHGQSARRISGVTPPPRFQSPIMAGLAAAMCQPRMMAKRRRIGASPAATRARRANESGTPGR